MTTSLSEMLRNLAVESGEILPDDGVDHSQMGAEEITVITDETQSELEEAVEEMAETVEKLENADAGAEKLVDATESLESAVRDLRALREQNLQLSGPAVQMFVSRVTDSMEARDIPAQIFSGVVEGLTASFESNRSEDYSTEAEEKSEGLIRRLVNMLVAAGKAVANWIKEFYQTLGKSGKAIRASGQKLERVGAAVKGEAKGELKGSSYGYLVVGGSVNGKKALETLLDEYQGSLLTITKGIRTGMKQLIEALKAGDSAKIAAEAKAAAGKMPSKASFDLPGGYKAEYEPTGGEEGFTGVKFAIKKGEAAAAGNFAPLSGAEIKALGAEIVSVGDKMIAASNDSKQAVADINSVLSTANSAVAKFQGATPEEIKEAKKVIRVTQSAMSSLKGVVPTYVKHMGVAAKQAYKLGMASAAKHGGAAVKAEGGEGGSVATTGAARKDHNSDRVNTSDVQDRKNKD